MEEKKLDINSIIGFVLIALILIYMLYQNQPTPEELQAQEEARQEQVEADKVSEEAKDEFKTTPVDFTATQTTDSTQLATLQNKVGAFAYSASLSSAQDATTVLENDVLKIIVNNKGGYFEEVKLKQFTDFDSVPVYLIKDQNAILLGFELCQ